MKLNENNTWRKTSNMDETPEDFEKLDAAVLAESKKSPLEDCSHLPAMRLEERHILAWLKSRIPVPVQGLRLCRRIRRGIGLISVRCYLYSPLNGNSEAPLSMLVVFVFLWGLPDFYSSIPALDCLVSGIL